MNKSREPIERLINTFQERAKELNCLYRVEESLADYDRSVDEVCPEIVEAIPPGWQFPDVCQARITLDDKVYQSPGFAETAWSQRAEVMVEDAPVGTIEVFYTGEMPAADDGPFLKEETRLINTIAERLGYFILHQRLRNIVQNLESARKEAKLPRKREWQIILKMYHQADHRLYLNMSRKMLNQLCWQGVEEAEEMYQSLGADQDDVRGEILPEASEEKSQWHRVQLDDGIAAATFEMAAKHLSDTEILGFIQKWVQEDRLNFIIQVVNRKLPLPEVVDAVRRFHHLPPEEKTLPEPGRRGINVALTNRLLSDQLAYINVAKDNIDLDDFHDLTERLIYGFESQGKLGGKSAGLYLAGQIMKNASDRQELLKDIRLPKTWYLTSDVLLYFMHYDDFDQIVEQKYKDLSQVTLEYPHIVRTFKRARFPADITDGLSLALDDFGHSPLIVRSSSLLEDRMGATFAGLYKSVFLGNQGTKQQRLSALKDAIAEVYASTFGPDPICYRAERGLLDFSEEMGVMIQEVVGQRIGRFFMPAYGGVAFADNEFRWSPLIKKTDGLVRMVPGLGTRAVERTGEDYAVLLAPGQPNLRINTSIDDIVRYSPRKIDVINLESNRRETVPLEQLLKEIGEDFPRVREIFSVYKKDHLYQTSDLDIDFQQDHLVATFNGLVARTPFIKQMDAVLRTLEEALGHPVEVEFASDGNNLFLLQCRPQSYAESQLPATIPLDVPTERTIFSAGRFVPNGHIYNIPYLVYIDSQQYAALSSETAMARVGDAVSRINKLLPRRQFVLIGPGRWGCLGDPRLGIRVTYSDINNTALLAETPVADTDHQPHLSVGTHFFQDLIESRIPYLLLYADSDQPAVNLNFLNNTPSTLGNILPDFADLEKVIRIIDLPAVTGGQTLQVYMNGHVDKALGIIGFHS